MKKLFFAALAIAAFVSCSKSESVEGPTNGNATKAIGFDQPYLGKNTKSASLTAFAVNSKIGVFSKKETADDMVNVELTKNSSAWEYSPVRYYEANKAYKFQAYYPYVVGKTSMADAFTDYTVSTTLADQEDLMFSEEETITWNGTDASVGAIQFKMKHALSQVKFTIATDQDYSTGYTLKIKGVTLKGAGSKATMSIANNAGTWGAATVPADYEMPVADLVPTTAGVTVTTATNDVFMLVPQTIAADALTAEFKIDVQYTTTDPGQGIPAGEKTVTVKIPAGTWAINTIYNYKATLDLPTIVNMKPISFGEPTINGWDSSNPAETPIP